jgi:hypothetical protein
MVSKEKWHLLWTLILGTPHIGANFFFFWWGLLHGPQQGPDRMKEKNLKDGEKENSCLKQKNPP